MNIYSTKPYYPIQDFSAWIPIHFSKQNKLFKYKVRSKFHKSVKYILLFLFCLHRIL